MVRGGALWSVRSRLVVTHGEWLGGEKRKNVAREKVENKGLVRDGFEGTTLVRVREEGFAAKKRGWMRWGAWRLRSQLGYGGRWWYGGLTVVATNGAVELVVVIAGHN
ncbi:unnamed protein product, partial [Sphenostylis stenocarpa]